MQTFSFLPDLKLVLLSTVLVMGCLAACFRPESHIEFQHPVSEVVNNDVVLHVGQGQSSIGKYQNLDEAGRVAILIQKDQLALQVKYNLKGVQAIMLRLYDQAGSLQHIEKITNVYQGMEKDLDLAHLNSGTYRLQLSTADGIMLSQHISLHTKNKL